MNREDTGQGVTRRQRSSCETQGLNQATARSTAATQGVSNANKTEQYGGLTPLNSPSLSHALQVREHDHQRHRSPERAIWSLRKLLADVEKQQAKITDARFPHDDGTNFTCACADVPAESLPEHDLSLAHQHVAAGASHAAAASTGLRLPASSTPSTVSATRAVRRIRWLAQWSQKVLESYPPMDDSKTPSPVDCNFPLANSSAAVTATVAERPTDMCSSSSRHNNNNSIRNSDASNAEKDLYSHTEVVENCVGAALAQAVAETHANAGEGDGIDPTSLRLHAALTEDKCVASATHTRETKTAYPLTSEHHSAKVGHEAADGEMGNADENTRTLRSSMLGEVDNLDNVAVDRRLSLPVEQDKERCPDVLTTPVKEKESEDTTHPTVQHPAGALLHLLTLNKTSVKPSDALIKRHDNVQGTVHAAREDLVQPTTASHNSSEPHHHQHQQSEAASQHTIVANSSLCSPPPPAMVPRDRPPLCCDVGLVHDPPLTPAQQRAVLLRQDGCCAHCGTSLPRPPRSFAAWCSAAMAAVCGTGWYRSCCACTGCCGDRSHTDSDASHSDGADGGSGGRNGTRHRFFSDRRRGEDGVEEGETNAFLADAPQVDDARQGSLEREHAYPSSLSSISSPQRQRQQPRGRTADVCATAQSPSPSPHNVARRLKLTSSLTSRVEAAAPPAAMAHEVLSAASLACGAPSSSTINSTVTSGSSGGSSSDFPGAFFCVYEGCYLCPRCFFQLDRTSGVRQRYAQRVVEPEEWQARPGHRTIEGEEDDVSEQSPVRTAVTNAAERVNRWWVARHIVDQSSVLTATQIHEPPLSSPPPPPLRPAASSSSSTLGTHERQAAVHHACVIPARVLLRWDFRRYAVSTSAASTLQRLCVPPSAATCVRAAPHVSEGNETRGPSFSSASPASRAPSMLPLPALYNISRIHPALYAQVPALAAASQLRKRMCLLHSEAWWCPRYRAEVWGVHTNTCAQDTRGTARPDDVRGLSMSLSRQEKLLRAAVTASGTGAGRQGSDGGVLVRRCGARTPLLDAAKRTPPTHDSDAAVSHETAAQLRQDDTPSVRSETALREADEDGEAEEARRWVLSMPPPPLCPPRRRYLVERAEGWSLQDLCRLTTLVTTSSTSTPPERAPSLQPGLPQQPLMMHTPVLLAELQAMNSVLQQHVKECAYCGVRGRMLTDRE